MNTGRFAFLFLALIILSCVSSVLAVADQSPASLAQANEEKARAHYVAGDAALKSNDVLTAVVELESALRLKPSSAYCAKTLAAAAAKLGADGAEAYAHYINAADLQDRRKLDDAGKELGLALAYHPGGLTPQCLTAKALELADLQKALKPVDTTPTTVAADTKKTATAKATTAKTTAAKASTSTAKKTSSATKSSTTKSKPKSVHISTPKAVRPPTYHAPRSYRTTSRLSYVHSYTINGHKVPGHYTIKPARPAALPAPH